MELDEAFDIVRERTDIDDDYTINVSLGLLADPDYVTAIGLVYRNKSEFKAYLKTFETE